MKAVLLMSHGGPEMLATGMRQTRPPGQVRWWSTFTRLASTQPITKYGWAAVAPICCFPYILGRDFSGVVSATGAEVTDLAVGDAVFGVCDQGIEGAYAEKIAIKAAIIAKKPESLGHAEAAAMALTSLTALRALEVRRSSKLAKPF